MESISHVHVHCILFRKLPYIFVTVLGGLIHAGVYNRWGLKWKEKHFDQNTFCIYWCLNKLQHVMINRIHSDTFPGAYIRKG